MGQRADWQRYTDSLANFSVLFPKGEILHKVDTVNAAVGELYYHTFLHNNEGEEGISVYMLSYVTYPESSIHHDSTELLEPFFQNTIEAAEESVYGELAYQDNFEMRGYPGKVWRIHYNKGNAVIHTRAIVAGNAYYTLQTVSSREYALSPEAETFFDSFRFLQSPG